MITWKSHHFLGIYFSLLALIFLAIEFNRLGDFYIYLEASSEIFNNVDLYHKLYGNPALFYYYGNPFLTLLLFPLTLLPVTAAAFLWKLINLIALFRIWQLMQAYFPGLTAFDRQSKKITATVLIGSFFLVYSNLHEIQLTILMLFLCLEGLYRIQLKNSPTIGGVFISIALVFKLTPIVLLPYLLAKQKFKSFLVATFCIFVFILLPAAAIGWEQNVALWNTWFINLTPDNPEWAIFDMNNRKNHGLSALFSSLFISDLKENIISLTHRRYIVDLGRDNVEYLIHVSRLFLILLTLFFIKKRKSYFDQNLKMFWEISYLFLIIPLFFPQQRLYNFIFLLPSLFYLSNYFYLEQKFNKWSDWKFIVFSISIVIINLELILGIYRSYFWYHKSMTYANLFLLVLLVSIRPWHFKLEEKNKFIKKK